MDNLESLIGKEIYFEKPYSEFNLYSAMGAEDLTSAEIVGFYINKHKINDEPDNNLYFLSVMCEIISDGELFDVPLDEIYII